MYGRRAGGHHARISGGFGPPNLYSGSRLSADLGGSIGSVPEFRGRIVCWNLSRGARVTAGPDRRLEVRVMALMKPSQARENFYSAMETLRTSKVRSALTVIGIVIGVSS